MAAGTDLHAYLRLARTDGVGPVTFFGLLARFGSAQSVIDNWADLTSRSNRLAKLAEVAEIDRELTAIEAIGGQILCAQHPLFSPFLAAITPPPPLISVLGDASLLQKPSIAIVGARSASAAGQKIARMIAADLGAAQKIIVSGLARGIDGAAHHASLATGTIAVLAGGVDHIYPPEHETLYRSIAEQGLIVSENRIGANVMARDFPRRNRIISGLSQAVVIVEAEARSGSLITARYGAEQGRDVCAVPGSPLDPRAAGTNGLIQDGAFLVTSAEDVLNAIAKYEHRNVSDPGENQVSGILPPVHPDEQAISKVLQALSPTPTSLDDLVVATGLNWRTLAAIIVELELDGHLSVKSGGMITTI